MIDAPSTATKAQTALDLVKDPKAWLYFLAASLGSIAAAQDLSYRSVCAALATGFLAVKAYTSPTTQPQ